MLGSPRDKSPVVGMNRAAGRCTICHPPGHRNRRDRSAAQVASDGLCTSILPAQKVTQRASLHTQHNTQSVSSPFHLSLLLPFVCFLFHCLLLFLLFFLLLFFSSFIIRFLCSAFRSSPPLSFLPFFPSFLCFLASLFLVFASFLFFFFLLFFSPRFPFLFAWAGASSWLQGLAP